jgi:hypothetical protein
MARAPGEAAKLVLRALASGEGTLAAIAAGTGLTERQVSDAAAKLDWRGLVDRPAPGLYRLTVAGRDAARSGRAPLTTGPKGPSGARRRVADTFRSRAWHSMRIRRAFSAAEVATDAARGEADPIENVHRYLLQLEGAGYVMKAGPHPRSTPPARRAWRLVRDTGPLAPVWSAAKREMQDDNPRQEERCRGRS